MQSTFSGLELGKRSLMAQQKALNTVGHNLANASTEGYSRQRVILKPFDPLYMPGLNRDQRAGQIGQGAIAARVERVHDQLLEKRIVSQGNHLGYWDTRHKYLEMLDQVYHEPGDLSVRGLMDRFWDAWQELSIHPEESAARQAVIQRGESLITGLHRRYDNLKEIGDMVNQDVISTVERVNSILHDISALNTDIVRVKGVGDNPNDLLDRRDLLVRELSEIMEITVENRDPDEFQIHTGGMHLIQGRVVKPLEARPNIHNKGYADVVWSGSKDPGLRETGQIGPGQGELVSLRSGRLGALVEMRDTDVREEIQSLDMLTINFIDLVNENHREGFGLNGKTGLDFFQEYPLVLNSRGNYDRTGEGVMDSTYLFRVQGNNVLDPQQQIGIQGTIRLSGREGITEIDYYPTDTVEQIMKRINQSGSEVVARLNRDGYLSLKGSPAENRDFPDFVIRYMEDDGEFLAGYTGILAESGEAGAYTWQRPDAIEYLRGDETTVAVAPLSNPSGWIEVNRSLKNDPGSIAAGFGEDGRPAAPGDGSAALAIAGLRNSDVMVGRVPNFDEYFSQSVAKVGLKGEAAVRALDTEEMIMKNLQNMRESISGVSIDEELANMIKFQHGYNAAARFITEVDRMLDTIINRLGV